MKDFLKFSLDAIATLVVVPAWACYCLSRTVLDRATVFPGFSQAFSLIPGKCGVYLRRAFYRLVFRRCDAGASISFGTVFSHPDCSIGRNAYVGVFCCLGEITLEDDVLIGSHVSIMNGSGQHGIDRLDIPIREQPGRWPHITIGQDTWIGDRAIIMANVGRHCVIGAGSVVTEPIPDFAIAVGSPAKVIRYRNGDGMAATRPLREAVQ